MSIIISGIVSSNSVSGLYQLIHVKKSYAKSNFVSFCNIKQFTIITLDPKVFPI